MNSPHFKDRGKLPDFGTGAACRKPGIDPELFFPLQEPEQAQEAIAVCKSCPFREACLRFAMDHAEVGIWGGTTLKERMSLRRQERAARRRVAA